MNRKILIGIVVIGLILVVFVSVQLGIIGPTYNFIDTSGDSTAKTEILTQTTYCQAFTVPDDVISIRNIQIHGLSVTGDGHEGACGLSGVKSNSYTDWMPVDGLYAMYWDVDALEKGYIDLSIGQKWDVSLYQGLTLYVMFQVWTLPDSTLKLDMTSASGISGSSFKYTGGTWSDLGYDFKAKIKGETAFPLPEPQFTFSPDMPLVDEVVTFDATGSECWGYEIYHWDFEGDGISDLTITNSPIVTHVYTNAGTYFAELTLEDDSGQRESVDHKVVVIKEGTQPVACFDYYPDGSGGEVPRVGMTINVDASCSTNANSYRWNWGDGSEWTSWFGYQTAEHVYVMEGTYTISLKARNSILLTDTATKSITIESPLDPDEITCYQCQNGDVITRVFENDCPSPWTESYPDDCGDSGDITVTIIVSDESSFEPISNALVKFGSEYGLTNSQGTIDFSLEGGAFITIEVTVDGYEKSSGVYEITETTQLFIDLKSKGFFAPGFELLALLGALGIAFIILRKKR